MRFVKPRRYVDTVHLHHSGTDYEHHDNIDFIRKIHVTERGWSDVGYHFFITKSGEVLEGRPLEKIPASIKGRNANVIAICLSGKEEFTPEQLNSLRMLCEEIASQYANEIKFYGHKEYAKTACPGYDYTRLLDLNEHHRMVTGKGVLSFLKKIFGFTDG